MEDRSTNEACRERFKSLQKDVENLKDIHGRELKEIKNHNKWQDEEYRNMNRYMQNISEAIVEMKTMNKNMQEILMQNSDKVKEIDEKIDNRIEATDIKIDALKDSLHNESLKSYFDVRSLIKQWIPILIILGLFQLVLSVVIDNISL